MPATVALVLLLIVFILWRSIAILAARKRASAGHSLAAVAGPPKDHWLTGNFQKLFRDGLKYNLGLFAQYGGVVKVHGIFGAKQLLVADPRALHHIVVKEQDVYQETDMFIMTNKLIFGEGLISTLGEQHRKQRKMLNPVFSLANMRQLLPTTQPIADTLLERLCAELSEKNGGSIEVDVLPWMARSTMEYVSRAVLGISLDTLDPNKTNEYADAIRAVNPTALKAVFLRPFVPVVVRTMSKYWQNKLVDWAPFPVLREIRDISHVLDRSARKIYREKKAEMESTASDPSRRDNKDLMSIMLKANMSTSEKDRLSEDELVGQINTLLLGGQETTTSALARILHLLACDPHAQARLRTELRAAGSEGAEGASLPYDTLMALPFLDAVVRETLRVHPPTSTLHRTCVRDAVLPLAFPVRSLSEGRGARGTREKEKRELREIHVPKGTNVLVSILGANHHPAVWGADASEWRPERWLGRGGAGDVSLADGNGGAGVLEDRKAVPEHENEHERGGEGTPGCQGGVKFPGVYATMMTFLGGGRACIGFKFAEMEIKQVISTLVSTLHFALPSAVNEDGVKKEVYWRMDGLQVPVVHPPHGDGKTMQVPLDVRLVGEDDFL